MGIKKRLIYLIFIFSSLCLCGSAEMQICAQPSQVSFQLISEEDSKPVVNRDVYIFNGDYKPESQAGSDPYPYNEDAIKKEWYLAKARTDNDGKFLLDIRATKGERILFKPGPGYRTIAIGKYSDVKRTKSESHILITSLEKGQTKAKRNDIYDLDNHRVKEIWPDGRIKEKSFKDVILTARKR